ncbi:transglycosylase SLT domain-containing protein [Ferrimonas balearica]|uniref:transglycosylase SLT domain-containing protein n=1 Tax=Ferrimonas balearica TaxID=44012 RepID=UPI001C9A24B4|nr:transglycosylase SLT domain-containing protein [Ferrimonas balearica]MBY5920928.1 transglycosylase SLT domain-containing protein [Ferrimonas balearica]MBY5996387.1 transglycosylase SLT domain-containing protein [Ferrimonas balearica]
MKLHRWACCGLLCLFTFIHSGAQAASEAPVSSGDTDTLERDRARYVQARDALSQGLTSVYYPLRRQLDDYPLTPYLDYHYRLRQLNELTAQQTVEILQSLAPTPLYHPFKHRYLVSRGSRQDWNAFLTISPEPPRNETLRCYYYRAKLSQGDTATAWDGAESLWLYGKSRDKACDPLFKAWTKAGQRGDEMVWQRMLLAYEAGQVSLLRYLNSNLSKAARTKGDLLVRLYTHPNELRHTPPLTRMGETGQAIAAVTLKRLAKKDASRAWNRYNAWRDELGKFEPEVRYALLYRALIQNGEWSSKLDPELAQSASDNLVIIRLRKTIFEADWAGLLYWMEHLSEENANKSEWRFWRGYALKREGQQEAGLNLWLALANERNFYGFQAAQQLGQPYAMNITLPTISEQSKAEVVTLEGVLRIQELMALGREPEAREEWRWQMVRLTPSQQTALTAIAFERQWHFLAVDGTIIGKMWDALPWRFPTAYGDEFLRYAEMRELDMTLLQAVARRESALYPQARSHADAYGLMQLLPSTAKRTAKQIGARYGGPDDLYEPKRNIQLGSAYYQGLMERYDGNRLLASAAYNAGPHRVTRWLGRSDGSLDAARFVATVPFRETREYIEAILSYQLIYAALAGREIPLMSEPERTRDY